DARDGPPVSRLRLRFAQGLSHAPALRIAQEPWRHSHPPAQLRARAPGTRPGAHPGGAVHPALGNALLPALLADARFLVAFRRIHELGVPRIPVAEEKRIELPANSLAVDQQPDVTAALEVVPLPVAGAEPAVLAVHHHVLGMSHPGERNEPDGGRWNGQQPD